MHWAAIGKFWSLTWPDFLGGDGGRVLNLERLIFCISEMSSLVIEMLSKYTAIVLQ